MVSSLASNKKKVPPSPKIVKTQPSARKESSSTKMLSILDLFTAEKPVWATNDLIEALETSRSTGYRYIKHMQEFGLLSAVGNGFYVLGPRIIEMDLQIRNCDPLTIASRGVLEQLVDTTGHSALLCTVYSNSVLCVATHLAPLSPENLFSRGQRRPLFRGAVSKVILAHIPFHRLKSIYTRNAEVIREVDLGDSWDAFRSNLNKIRKAGYAITYGEFNPNIVGVASPIFNAEDGILGSVGVAWHKGDVPESECGKIALAVKRAAREITQRVSQTMNGMALPPRAVGQA
jgi:DNA-binding IclR family transcriptional regulator